MKTLAGSAGLNATINSDDPAYLVGGYVNQNYVEGTYCTPVAVVNRRTC